MRRLAGVIAACALGVAIPAQTARPPQPQSPQSPLFRSSVDIVHLDVSVLDKNRKPVRGLTAADFTVLENGKPQPVSVFSAVDVPDPETPSAPWMRDVAPDVLVNTEIKDRRLFLIAIDDATMVSDPWALKKVKEIARTVIDHLGPQDLAGVIFTRDNRYSQDFTSNRSRLLNAVDQFTIGFAEQNPGDENARQMDDLWMLYSVGMLQRAVDYFGELPDRRKSIIYVSTGVAFDLKLALAPRDGGPRSTGQALRQTQLTLKDRLTDLFRQAQRSNVNVYSVDACGLRPPNEAGVNPCVPNKGLKLDYLVNVAASTGGRPIINTNEFGPELAEIFEENGSYYLIGFQSTNAKRDGSLRRLQVKVNRKDVSVRTRTGYWAPKDGDRQEAARQAAPLEASIAGVLPKADVPIFVTAAPFAIDDRLDAAVAIAVGIKQPVRISEWRTLDKVNLQIGAYNTDGKLLGSTRMSADVALRAGAPGQAEYEMIARLDLRPGRYQLRVGTEIGAPAITGSLYYDVDVPDFAKEPLSISGLVLGAVSGPASVQDRKLDSVLPFTPTTRRAFSTTDRVTAFARVYQGGSRPVIDSDVRFIVRNSDDVVVIDRRESLPAARFAATRATDISIELPLAQLPAGAYLLTIEASAGAKIAARRDSRFQVVRP